MTLKRYNGSNFETVPFRYYDGSNWRGTPLYRYNGTEWVDAFLDNGLVAYYPFDGDVGDYSGNNNDGTDNTSAGFVSGRIGSDAKDFDGTDDYIDIGGNNYAGLSTYSAWIYPVSQSSANEILTAGTSSGELIFALADNKGTAQLFLSDTSDESTNLNLQAGTVLTDTWHHIAATWDGSAAKLYLDSTEVASDSSTISDYHSDSEVASASIGARSFSSSRYTDGHIDNVRIYDDALTSEEIDHLYQHGRVI